MATSYDDAVAALYQAPHADFVSERKRLAGELKAAGDKAGASRLGKLARPPISAWVVNQLWWHARDGFAALFATAAQVRGGDLGATAAHREAIAKLRLRASAILGEAGNAAAESTLRRVTTTLAALAASGGFAPDPEGALAADRDPPGFEVLGMASPPAEATGPRLVPEPAPTGPANDNAGGPDDAAHRRALEVKRALEAEAKREQAEAAAARKKAEHAEQKRLAAIHGVEAELGIAKTEVARKQKELERLRQAVETAEAAVAKSQAVVDELAAKRAGLESDD